MFAILTLLAGGVALALGDDLLASIALLTSAASWAGFYWSTKRARRS